MNFITIALAISATLCNFSPEEISPRPAEINIEKGSFKASNSSVWVDPALGNDATTAVINFAERLKNATGKPVDILPENPAKGFVFSLDKQLAEEEYTLQVSKTIVQVKASTGEGAIWALRSIEQMLPVAIYTGNLTPKAKWSLQCCNIKDKPRFGYRGLLLDVSRHFFTVEEVKKVINLMSVYKLNRLHWHLTDDQGWRVEIKKYPLLTEIGAWRDGTQIGRDRNTNDGIRHGGFYTQEQIKDIVAYASERGIEIIPEIDLPGHMQGALAAFPELGCTGGPYSVCTYWGISKDVLCPGKEKTFEFLENVLDEVAALFPCKYFHIGGDECPTVRWESCPDCQKRIEELGLKATNGATAERMLQQYVTNRIKDFLEKRGKTVICWDEVFETRPDNKTVIMVWTGIDNIDKATRAGYDVIATPKWYCYTDYRQAQEGEPIGPGRVVTLEKLYSFDPYNFTGLRATGGKVLGVQINHWGEYFVTPEHMEYMLLPRLIAASEVQWTPAEDKDILRFKEILKHHQVGVIETLGFNYRK